MRLSCPHFLYQHLRILNGAQHVHVSPAPLCNEYPLARQVTEADLDWGRVYPSLSRIREVSAYIAAAAAVAKVAYAHGLTCEPEPAGVSALCLTFVMLPPAHSAKSSGHRRSRFPRCRCQQNQPTHG